MAKHKAMPSMPDEGRPESDAEYQDRVVDQLFRASWEGRQALEEHPPRAIIHEYPAKDEPPHIWKERKV